MCSVDLRLSKFLPPTPPGPRCERYMHFLKPPIGRPIKNETPKMALGDRTAELRFQCQIPDAETKSIPRNAAVPRRFQRPSNVSWRRPDCLAGVTGLELRSSETLGGANQASTLRCCADRTPTFLAETTGLPLQTERQCRRLMWPFLPRLGSRPAGDTAIVGLRW